MRQLDLLEFAAKQRNAGMRLAAEHADNTAPGWTDVAFRWIKTYALTHKQFISEECTAAAEKAGIRSPTDPRAWGAPFQRAAKQGVIKRVGYGVSTRRHLSPTPLWESQL